MACTNPGRLFVRKFDLTDSVDDVMRYANFLREEAGLSQEPPIDLIRIYNRFSIPLPKRVPLPNLQGLLLSPESGLIVINEDDSTTRQRFTEAHELMEFFFSALPSGSGWAARRVGVFKLSEKENLCNEGAAELLMPRATFAPRVYRIGVSYRTACQLASEFQVSVTAALVRVARVGPGRHAVALWRMKNKPTEVRDKTPDEQLSLFPDFPRKMPLKKLRVEWSFSGPEAPFIPNDKSVPEDSSVYTAWQDGDFTIGRDHLDLGTVRGMCRCESQPFDSAGERYVLSLLHLPADRGCGPHLQNRCR